jgi:hypothetical protein
MICMEKGLFAIAMMALLSISGFFTCARTAFAESFPLPGERDVPDPLYGVTVDDVSNITKIVNSSTNLSHMPTTRIVFHYGQAPSAYTSAANRIKPVSYIMGELVDSSNMIRYTLQQYHDRTAQYLSALGNLCKSQTAVVVV